MWLDPCIRAPRRRRFADRCRLEHRTICVALDESIQLLIRHTLQLHQPTHNRTKLLHLLPQRLNLSDKTFAGVTCWLRVNVTLKLHLEISNRTPIGSFKSSVLIRVSLSTRTSCLFMLCTYPHSALIASFKPALSVDWANALLSRSTDAPGNMASRKIGARSLVARATRS